MNIDVVKPFNFARGPVTKHYAKGEHEVTAEVAAHAARHNFLGQGALTITDLKTGEVSGPHVVETLTLHEGKK